MSRRSLTFICQNCGATAPRWQGKCEACGEWNTLAEEGAERPAGPGGRKAPKGRLFKLEPLTGEAKDAPRLASGMAELDRVTGGGFVRGSVLLMAGDPGIGKSTLLIQATAALARAGHRAVYISGEEAAAQVRLRAERLGLSDAPVELAAETAVEDIIATLSEGKVPRLIVIDFNPDHVDRSGRQRPRHSQPGARRGPGADPLCQAFGRRHHPGRPRHQGWPDRRPPRGRAYGRCRAVVRGRRLAPVPHPARGQKPLRPDRRNRRVRNDRLGLARSQQSVRAVSVGARSRLARHRRLCRHGRHPAAAGRDPGAGGADLARHAHGAPWSAGTRAGCRW